VLETESKVTAVHSDYSVTVTSRVKNSQEVKYEMRETRREEVE